MTRLGVFAIIFDRQGRVLLGHRCDMDLWNLPGGRVERGELPTEAIVREVREETGLDVRVEKLVGVYGKKDKDELVFLFRCVVVSGQLQQMTPETDANRYFPPIDLPVNLIPKHRERIHDALSGHPSPLFKHQGGPDSRTFLQSFRNKQ